MFMVRATYLMPVTYGIDLVQQYVHVCCCCCCCLCHAGEMSGLIVISQVSSRVAAFAAVSAFANGTRAPPRFAQPYPRAPFSRSISTPTHVLAVLAKKMVPAPDAKRGRGCPSAPPTAPVLLLKHQARAKTPSPHPPALLGLPFALFPKRRLCLAPIRVVINRRTRA